MRHARLIGTLFALLIAVGCREAADDAGATITALRNADEFELISLEPSRMKPGTADAYHGWRVLGRTMIQDDTVRSRLIDALRAGADENDGLAAGCFNPRHGIHTLRDGKAFDILICFECAQAAVYVEGTRTASFLISDSPQKTFDDTLTTAGIPLAEKAKR